MVSPHRSLGKGDRPRFYYWGKLLAILEKGWMRKFHSTKSQLRVWAVAVGAVILGYSNSVSIAVGGEDVVRTNVCQLSVTPEAYYGKFVVIVGARVDGFTLGAVTLTDLHCEGLVVLRLAPGAEKRPEVRRMIAEFQKWDYTTGRPPMIVGDFSGRVEKGGFYSEVVPAINVEYIDNLSVSPDPPP